MSRLRGVLLAVLALLVVVWAGSSVTLPGSQRATPAAVAPDAGAATADGPLDLERAAERLRVRLEDAAARPRPPERNPFRFGTAPARPAPAVSPLAAVPAPAPAEVLPAAPAVSLIGIAGRTIDGTLVRTAVISMGGTLYYVAAGDAVGTAYDVEAVEAEAVQLRARPSGTPRRVTLAR